MKKILCIFLLVISLSIISCDNSTTNKYSHKDSEQVKSDFNAEVERFDHTFETYKAISNISSIKYRTYHDLDEDSMRMSHTPVDLTTKVLLDLNNKYFYTIQHVRVKVDNPLLGPTHQYKSYQLEMDYADGQYIKTEGYTYDCIRKTYSTEEDFLDIIERLQENEFIFPDDATYAQIDDKKYSITFLIEQFDDLNPDIFETYFSEERFSLNNQEKVVITFDFLTDTELTLKMEFDPMKYVKSREDYYTYLVIEEHIQLLQEVEKEEIDGIFLNSASSIDNPMFTLSAEHASNLYMNPYSENFYKYVLTPGSYRFDRTEEYEIYDTNGEVINYIGHIIFEEETILYINYLSPKGRQHRDVFLIVKISDESH